MFSETKITEIYCMTDDFCKEIAQFQEKYMVEDKVILKEVGHGIFNIFISNSLSTITAYCF